MQNFIAQALGGSQQCAKSLLEFDLADTPCVKLVISKALGVGIVAGGTILKIPQILKIISAKSVKGISFTSYLLETISYSIGVCYNWRNEMPISTYGEAVFINFQNFFILTLLMLYKNNYPGLILLIAACLLGSYAMYDPQITSSTMLTTLQWSTIFVSAASKMPQAYYNYANSSTGNLSAITVFLQFIGSAARIFTTLQEVSDTAILTSFLLATALNAVIAFQVVYYWKKAVKKKTK